MRFTVSVGATQQELSAFWKKLQDLMQKNSAESTFYLTVARS